MIKGASRRMVVLKHTGSRLFEEAYFILREETEAKVPRTDMIAEANRIVSANTLPPREEKPKRSPLLMTFFFLLGALVGGGGATLVLLLW
jgi:LPS O-antigen subunit length determinant protein (WzzB/FepE family)